jgi:hypothetical protein
VRSGFFVDRRYQIGVMSKKTSVSITSNLSTSSRSSDLVIAQSPARVGGFRLGSLAGELSRGAHSAYSGFMVGSHGLHVWAGIATG